MIVLDFDDFIPEEKSIKLCGKRFDVTSIPFEVSLKFNEAMPIIMAMSKSEKISEGDSDVLLKLIHMAFQLSDPDIEFEWVKKNVTLQRFNKIVELLTKAMFDEGKKKDNPMDESPMEI